MSLSRILVSACLLGRPVRYDGSSAKIEDQLMLRWQSEGRIVPLCPEVAAGFPTPRPPAEISPDFQGIDVLQGLARVTEDTGTDVTAPFIAGAEIALNTARRNNCTFALLTDGSPSCGSTFIFSGRFDGKSKPGQGVVAALLARNGIRVFPEHAILDLAKALNQADAQMAGTSPLP